NALDGGAGGVGGDGGAGLRGNGLGGDGGPGGSSTGAGLFLALGPAGDGASYIHNSTIAGNTALTAAHGASGNDQAYVPPDGPGQGGGIARDVNDQFNVVPIV